MIIIFVVFIDQLFDYPINRARLNSKLPLIKSHSKRKQSSLFKTGSQLRSMGERSNVKHDHVSMDTKFLKQDGRTLENFTREIAKFS